MCDVDTVTTTERADRKRNVMNDDKSTATKTAPSVVKQPTVELNIYHEKDENDKNLIRLALHKSPFFTCLDEEQVERFIQVAELKRYSAGQSIILEGCVDDFDVDVEGEEDSSTVPNDTSRAEIPVSEDQANRSKNKDDEFVTNAASSQKEEDHLTEEGFVLVEVPFTVPASEPAVSPANITNSKASVSDVASETLSRGPSDSSSKETKPLSTREMDHQVSSTLHAQVNSTDKNAPYDSPRDDPTNPRCLEPPPSKSGVSSYIYIIRNGQADVMYSQNVNPASLGAETVFGEGGFLFGRQHSASVVAATGILECYVVDAKTFRNCVLPSDNMTRLYEKHATHMDEGDDTPYMTMQDFINSCLDQGNSSDSSADKHPNQNEPSIDATDTMEATIQDALAGVRIANTFNILRNRTTEESIFSQRISLADFCLFHLLMARPDPEVDIIFLFIDERKRGVIYKEDISKFLKSSFDDFKFDMESEFIRRHFGKHDAQKIQRGIRPHQFSHFLVDLRREIGQQIFLQEVGKTGTPDGLPPAQFVQVLQKACGWRLPEGVAERLESIYSAQPVQLGDSHVASDMIAPTESSQSGDNFLAPKSASSLLDREANDSRLGAHCFSYCDFLAFQEVLGQLPGICSLIDRACEIKKGPVSADDFKVANRVLGMGGSLSRRQVDIIFQLFDLDGDGFVSHEDTVTVAGVEIAQRIDAVAGRQGALTFAPPPKYRHDATTEKAHADDFWMLLQNFSLTSIAGAIGVGALAPLDLVKTRLMNERFAISGQRMYHNSFDCFRIALQSEGSFGMYRGLLPQLIGIAPEKAIKLAVNDLLQQSLGSDDSGPNKSGLQYLKEMLAGGCAGACQLLITNPIEIVKIRMQLQGETARLLKATGIENPTPQSLRAVAKTLGYSGLFIGARACLLRDIPFGALYFPTYTFFKENLSNSERHSISAPNLLLAGTLSGVPASFLTTPADVIKTRLQVIPRPGELRYDGIRDCFTKIYEREGPAAFFRGSAMRVAKICPQFGISLVAYEQLSQLLGAQGLLSPTTVPVNPDDYFCAFPTRAINNKTNDADRLLKTLRPGGPWDEKR